MVVSHMLWCLMPAEATAVAANRLGSVTTCIALCLDG